MSKKNHDRHPLSERHFRQVVCRDVQMSRRMQSVWGLTWRPGDNTGHFLGKLFRPLGTATMMAQASYRTDNERRPGVVLYGISAQIDPNTAHVHYNALRLQHDFHLVPRTGGRRTVLDPTRNASWVSLALDVDQARQRATQRNYMLPAVPTLPQLYCGFGDHDQAWATFSATPSLRRAAAGAAEITWQGSDLHDLQRYAAEVATAKDTVFASWPAEVQQQRLREAWYANILKPGDPMNSTGLWLVPQEYVTKAYGVPRIFEYFGGLVGVEVFNVSRKLGGKQVPNPAIEVAQAAGIDLKADLEKAAETLEGDPRFLEIEQRLTSLVPAYRQVVGASVSISDEDLLRAICQPERKVQIEPGLGDQAEPIQIQAMRAALRPEISEACTDADILQAVQNPHGPLFASGLPVIQCLRRDARVPLEDSMHFTPEVLGRERVSATFWYAPEELQPKASPAHALLAS